MNERIKTFLQEMKDELVTIEQVQAEEEMITPEEKAWLLDEYEKFLEKQLKTSSQENQKFSIDPIEKQTTSYTWGTRISDTKFSPIQPHSFIIFAGETSSGKTAFSFDMAYKNAKNGIRTLYFSLEMTGEQIITRIARSYAGITKEQWREKSLIGETQRKAYKEKKLEIESEENLIVFGFKAGEIPNMKNILDVIEGKNPKLVFVDNLDLIALSNPTRLEHEQFVSKAFMNFTNEKKIPIVLLHHLRKTKEKTGIESVRGSGKITDDADAVYLCSRNLNIEKTLGDCERSAFSVFERKDRDFGEGGYHTYYFHKGAFYDDFQGKDPFFKS